jgi:hypothetical protein
MANRSFLTAADRQSVSRTVMGRRHNDLAPTTVTTPALELMSETTNGQRINTSHMDRSIGHCRARMLRVFSVNKNASARALRPAKALSP